MKLFMETTKIDVGKTVAEIQDILGRYGCCSVMSEYDKGEVTSVCFQVMFLNKTVPFKLPCRWECIYKNFVDRRALGKLRPIHKESEDIIQAKRVAWRQILRWVEAQMALVETDMVKVQEVFMPYMQPAIGKGKTLYEHVEHSEGKFLLENKS